MGIPLPFTGEFEVVIMIITSEPWLVWQKQRQRQNLLLERNGALRSARISAPQKYLTLPTLLERGCFVNRDLEYTLRVRNSCDLITEYALTLA